MSRISFPLQQALIELINQYDPANTDYNTFKNTLQNSLQQIAKTEGERNALMFLQNLLIPIIIRKATPFFRIVIDCAKDYEKYGTLNFNSKINTISGDPTILEFAKQQGCSEIVGMMEGRNNTISSPHNPKVKKASPNPKQEREKTPSEKPSPSPKPENAQSLPETELSFFRKISELLKKEGAQKNITDATKGNNFPPVYRGIGVRITAEISNSKTSFTITKVFAGSFASSIGLAPGDKIVFNDPKQTVNELVDKVRDFDFSGCLIVDNKGVEKQPPSEEVIKNFLKSKDSRQYVIPGDGKCLAATDLRNFLEEKISQQKTR